MAAGALLVARVAAAESEHAPATPGAPAVDVTVVPEKKVDPAPPSWVAAYGEGFTATSRDPLMSMQLRVRAQLRFTEELEDGSHAESFAVRRLRLTAKGKLLRDDVEYYVQLGVSTQDLDPEAPSIVRDASIQWKAARDLELRFGQMKVPFALQRRVSSGALQFVDRSIVTGELNLDRDVGLVASSSDLLGLGKRLGYDVGVFGGDGRNRTVVAPGVLAVARLTLRPFGAFDDLKEGDHTRSATPKLALGGGLARNWGTDRARSTIGTVWKEIRADYTHAGVDLSLRWRGLSLQGEWMTRIADHAGETGTPPPGGRDRERTRSARGFYAQAGFLFANGVELVGRFGRIDPVTDLPGPGTTREAGGGVNWYLQQHDLKLQGDYFALVTDKETTHQLRAQVQFWL